MVSSLRIFRLRASLIRCSSMAIAFDNYAEPVSQSAATSQTFAYNTGTGANRILFVCTTINVNASEAITGITYNGVAMTQVGKIGTNRGNASLTAWNYVYVLVNPASGSNNVVVSTSATRNFLTSCATYTGAAQTGQPDAHGTDTRYTSGTQMSQAVTTILDNCWTFLYYSQVNTATAGTGTTIRSNSGDIEGVADSNGVIHPAGSTSLIINTSATIDSTNDASTIICSFAPALASTPPSVVDDYKIYN